MDMVMVYKCLCDRTRLRILNLLSRTPLCVCHIQDVLQEPQVKISKHLRYLRENGLIESDRRANWIIYRIHHRKNRLLSENLKCLQDIASENAVFRRDLERLSKADISPACTDQITWTSYK